MKLRRHHISKNPVAFLCSTVSVSCFFILFLSLFRLPVPDIPRATLRTKEKGMTGIDEKIGKFGEMVIEMLPEDLPFTLFLPSKTAFEQILRLHLNESFVGDKARDTYAVLTRVLGFSAVPRMIGSAIVPYGQEIDYDSLVGLTLYVSRDNDGMLVVNRLRSEHVDLQWKRNIIVHIMDGVIMDAEFEQSVLPDYSEDDGR